MEQEHSQPPMQLRARLSSAAVQSQPRRISLDLRKKPRPGEAVIQGFLAFSRRRVDPDYRWHRLGAGCRRPWCSSSDPKSAWCEFFTGTAWQPRIGQFGIFPLLNATLLTSIIGMLVALPLGLGDRDLSERVRVAQGARHPQAGRWRSWPASRRWSTAFLRSTL